MPSTTAHLPTKMLDHLRPMADGVCPPTPARVLLRHGVLGRTATLAPSLYRGPAGRCFDNTGRAFLALTEQPKNEGWRYCEGYAHSARFDVIYEHAWLLDGEDKVWDTTWPHVEGVTYLGLPFDAAGLLDALDDSPEPVLFGDWDRDFRLLGQHHTCCPPPV